jgi:hypothetical protein
MPGICPDCVKLVPNGENCPTCGARLVPASQWARERERLLPRPADPSPAGPPPSVEKQAPDGYGVRFFLGCLAGVAAAIATVVIVFAVKGG